MAHDSISNKFAPISLFCWGITKPPPDIAALPFSAQQTLTIGLLEEKAWLAWENVAYRDKNPRFQGPRSKLDIKPSKTVGHGQDDRG